MQLSTGFRERSSLSGQNDLQAIGRHGKLSLKFRKGGDRTVLHDSFSNIPMQAFQPFYLDETGCAYAYIVNPTGGLVGGDRIDTDITINDYAHAFITTPSATKVYRSSGNFSMQNTNIMVKRNGIIEYMPGYVIPFGGSLFSQKTKVFMEEAATAFILDSFTTGRVSSGEHLCFGEYRSTTEIEYCGVPIVTDKILLRPDVIDYNDLGFLESFTVMAVLYIVFDNPPLEKPLMNDIKNLMDGMNDILGGVSALPSRGVAVRLLGTATFPAEKALITLWSAARKRILNLESFPSSRMFSL